MVRSPPSASSPPDKPSTAQRRDHKRLGQSNNEDSTRDPKRPHISPPCASDALEIPLPAQDDESICDSGASVEAAGGVERTNKEATAALSGKTIVQVRDLNPLLAGLWTLIGQVVSRGSVRQWNTVRGSGQLFDFLIVDSAGDTIKATVFNEGVDEFNGVIQNGALCSFSGGSVKTPNRAFSSARSELVFDGRAVVRAVQKEAGPKFAKLSIGRPFRELAQLSSTATVTLIGIVTRVDAFRRITTSKGKNCIKREFLVVDDSMKKLICTVWGVQAQDELSRYEGEPVLIERATFNDYQGRRSINVGVGGCVHFEPALPQATRLREWFAEGVNVDEIEFVESTCTSSAKK